MLVTFPVLLLLVDVWPLQSCRRGGALSGFLGLVMEKLPLFVLSAAAAAVTVLPRARAGRLRRSRRPRCGSGSAVALHAVAWYVRKTLLPEGLSIFYPLEMPGPGAIAAGAATLALFLGLALHPRVHPAVRIGVLWYLVALAPVSGLVRVGDQLVADRYSYLPSVGLLIAVVFGLGSLLPEGRRPVLVAVAAASTTVVASFAIATSADATRFRDGLALFSSALENDPKNWLAHMKVGDELVRRGLGPKAVPHYAAAFRLRPEWDGAAGNLGQALANSGRCRKLSRLWTPASEEPFLRVAPSRRGRHLRAGRNRRASLGAEGAGRCVASPSGAGKGEPLQRTSLRRARGEAGR